LCSIRGRKWNANFLCSSWNDHIQNGDCSNDDVSKWRQFLLRHKRCKGPSLLPNSNNCNSEEILQLQISAIRNLTAILSQRFCQQLLFQSVFFLQFDNHAKIHQWSSILQKNNIFIHNHKCKSLSKILIYLHTQKKNDFVNLANKEM